MSKKYVTSSPDRHGRIRHRFRRNGVTRYLPGDPGSDQFEATYQECLRLAKDAETNPIKRKLTPQEEAAPEGSVAALIRDYRATNKFLRLKPPTKRQYDGAFGAFIDLFGKARVADIDVKFVLNMVNDLNGTPGVANAYLRCMKLLLNHAVLCGDIPTNPASRVQPIKLGEIDTWAEADLAKFEKRWPNGTVERRIYNLALYTGQRASDLRRMMVHDIEDGVISIRQSKTGEVVVLPIHPALQADLDEFPPKGEFLIHRADGKGYSGGVISKLLREALRKAKLPENLKLHGLRKATCRRLAEAGASEREIMSVSGHRSPQMVSHYVKAASQRKMAAAAMAKLLAV
ncbi:hypothetical protein DLJ53_27630 [Acuticoccus sediminis]|uniref:Tyr recombinase domain-containing protein n=1 Tax=Acuticoccus sediminis TaxID=2184697 RepID=A0A8B2NF49_9HYPH|nr:tyrosine-type recombinase/integrase [Acuticoccus sediminis]RAH97628.1 hypothetical protein DLJ53_27630 [Acuticoccus sediminis]